MATVIAEHQGKKLDEKELEDILVNVESLTDEEAEQVVSDSVSKDTNCHK